MKYSIIMPSYQSEETISHRLPVFLESLENVVNKDEVEVIVVLDGTTDNSYDLLSKLENSHAELRHVGYSQNQGKGHAVFYGLQYAHGDYVAYYDVDCSTELPSLIELFKLSESKSVSVIGSRYLTKKNIEQVLIRRVAGLAFNYLVRHTLSIPFKDTQCGCKVFTKEAVNYLLTQQWSSGYAFDVEILIKLLNEGYPVVEVPVKWRDEKRNFIINVLSILTMAPPMYKEVKQLQKRKVTVYD